MVGYDGGRVAGEGLADHVVVTAPSTSRASRRPRRAPITCCASWWSWSGELAPAAARSRVRARVEGTVQGVGFRPYVFRLARELRLGGYVLNDERGVLVEVEGDALAVDRFLARLPAEAPPLAVVERVAPRRSRRSGSAASRSSRAPGAARRTRSSSPTSRPATTASPSSSTPSTAATATRSSNCTNCGPRFTIVRGVPYDRPLTTMAGFDMCAALPAPSTTTRRPPLPRPADRLPRLRAGAQARRSLRGRAVDPSSSDRSRPRPGAAGGPSSRSRASAASTSPAGPTTSTRWPRLRARKHREEKPFALMVADLARRPRLVVLGDARAGAAARPGAADRARAPAPGRARGGRGRARARPSSA